MERLIGWQLRPKERSGLREGDTSTYLVEQPKKLQTRVVARVDVSGNACDGVGWNGVGEHGLDCAAG